MMPRPGRLVLGLALAAALSLSPSCVPAQSSATPAAEAARAVGDLASADGAIHQGAVEALGNLEDPTVLPTLEALRAGRLYLWTQPDGRRELVIAREKVTREGKEVLPLARAYGQERLRSADGQDLYADPQELAEVSADRRLRGILQQVIERLRLLSPESKVRKAAAKTLAERGDPVALPWLHQAFTREKDPWTRQAIEEGFCLLTLSHPRADERIGAAHRLAEIHGTNALPRLQELLTQEQDASVLAVEKDAVRSLETWTRLARTVYAVFSGLSLGSILMLMALGLAITFGLMGVINMAHGELMMVGAYATFVMQGWFQAYLPAALFDFYFLAALPFAFVVTGGCGWLLERTIIRFLYGRPLETLLATWGVSLIFIQAARNWFGDLTAVTAPDWLNGGLEVMAGVQLPYNRLFIIAFTGVCVTVIHFLLTRSSAGLRMRAVTQNREMAACLGVRTGRVDAWAFALGAGLAGVAGWALCLIGNVEPGLGQNYIVDSFIVVVTGGVGKLAGTTVAALGIGWLNTLFELTTDSAVMGKVLILILVVLFLQRRPSGLFPARGRNVEA